jgi:hypothetical protein
LIGAFGWRSIAIGSMILLIFNGFTEELMFRGLLQRVADEIWGRAGFLLSGALFAIMYIGSLSADYVLFIGLVGLFFGWCVNRTGSIWGVVLAHGILSIGMLLVYPSMVQKDASAIHSIAFLGIWSGLLLALITIGVLVWNARYKGRLIVESPQIASLSPVTYRGEQMEQARSHRRIGWISFLAVALLLFLAEGMGIAMGVAMGLVILGLGVLSSLGLWSGLLLVLIALSMLLWRLVRHGRLIGSALDIASPAAQTSRRGWLGLISLATWLSLSTRRAALLVRRRPPWRSILAVVLLLLLAGGVGIALGVAIGNAIVRLTTLASQSIVDEKDRLFVEEVDSRLAERQEFTPIISSTYLSPTLTLKTTPASNPMAVLSAPTATSLPTPTAVPTTIQSLTTGILGQVAESEAALRTG